MAGDVPREGFPSFRQRVGDALVAGPSNSLIVLGRDRSRDGSPDRSAEPGAGSVSIVAGRATGGLDAAGDRASVYVCALTDVDDVLPDSSLVTHRGGSAVLAVADSVRIRARVGLRIVVGGASVTIGSDGVVTIEGDVRIGRDALQRAILGETFISDYLTHDHPVPSGGGISGPPRPTRPRDGYLARSCRLS